MNIATISVFGGAALLVSASLVSASIEPTTSIGTIGWSGAKADRLDGYESPRGDLLPVAETGDSGIAVSYRTGPQASVAIAF
jgi:hypothetical protein